MTKGTGVMVVALITLVFVLGATGFACSGDRSAATADSPTAIVPALETPSSSPTPETRTLEEEITAAYLRYWDVYARSVREVDGSRLPDAMTGPMLERTLREIEALRARGRAAVINVEHSIVVVEIDQAAGTATVHDEYRNRSDEVDRRTGTSVTGPAAGNIVSDTFYLVKVGDGWKVRDGLRLVKD